jgi:hypothetical protein
MYVYKLRADSDHYKALIMPGGDLFKFAGRFKGQPMGTLRGHERIRLDPDTKSCPKGDFPSLIPSVPVFSRRALEHLQDLLEGNGEAFRVIIAGDEYFLFNVTRVVDALDESRSELRRFDDGTVYFIGNHTFFMDKLVGLAIFRIPQLTDSDIFVTDTFVERVNSARLNGFWFPLVWSTEGSR